MYTLFLKGLQYDLHHCNGSERSKKGELEIDVKQVSFE